jgi:hypothetical protein
MILSSLKNRKSHKVVENQEHWGSEFSDDGFYGLAAPLKSKQDSRHYIPMTLIEKTIDSKYIAEIVYKDRNYIRELAISIKDNGIITPGKLTYDNNSVRLSDGNHRFLAAKQIGLTKFPVEIVRVDKHKARSVDLSELFPELMELIWQEK